MGDRVISAVGIAIPIWTIANASGAPLSGAKVNAWVPSSAGAPTATRRAIFTDAECLVPAANPYTLGTSGHGILYRNPASSVVLTVTDSAGATTYGQPWFGADLSNAGASANALNVATYAALTALTESTGLVDNGIYYTYARATEEDGGAGHWRYDSGSSATANGGTVLAIDGGGVGRFFRLFTGPVYANWFGLTEAASSGNAAALTAALAAHERVEVMPGAYYFDSAPTWPAVDNISLDGGARDQVAFFANFTNAPFFTIAGSGSTYRERPAIRNLAISFVNASTVPASMADDKTGSSVGINLTLVSRPQIESVTVYNALVGVYLGGVLAPILQYVLSIRASVGATSRYRGMIIDGEASNPLSYPSPNPSVTLQHVQTQCGTVTAGGEAWGFWAKGKLADLWFFSCEAGGGKYSYYLDLTEVATTNNLNILINRPVADGFTVSGIYIDGNAAVQPVIMIDGGYAAPAAGATGYGIDINDIRGVTVTGAFEVDGHSVTGAFTAVHLATTYNVNLVGVYAKQCSRFLNGSAVSESVIKGEIFHNGSGSPTFAEAILIATGTLCDIDITTASPATIWTDAIKVTTFTTSRVNVQRIGGHTNKLLVDGAAVTKGGWNSTLYVDGISTLVGLTVGGTPAATGTVNVVGAAGATAVAISDNTNASLYIKPAAGGVQFGTDAAGAIKIGGNGFVMDMTFTGAGAVALSAFKDFVTVVASLGTATAGKRAFVTDSNAALTAGIGAVVAGGGANTVPVIADGANWRIG